MLASLLDHFYRNAVNGQAVGGVGDGCPRARSVFQVIEEEGRRSTCNVSKKSTATSQPGNTGMVPVRVCNKILKAYHPGPGPWGEMSPGVVPLND